MSDSDTVLLLDKGVSEALCLLSLFFRRLLNISAGGIAYGLVRCSERHLNLFGWTRILPWLCDFGERTCRMFVLLLDRGVNTGLTSELPLPVK